MTNRFVKFAATAAPAALLLAAVATPADAKVLIMGDGGWEFSLDGSVNGFATWTSSDDKPDTLNATAGVGHFHVSGLGNNPGNGDVNSTGGAKMNDSFRVRTGLLPAVWGMNVKAPTTGGLDMAARIGLYPNISNNFKNVGDCHHACADLDMREIFFTVDGSWGQVLVGKTLSQFLGKNILTDMTLFGLGGVGTVAQAGGTTLGRIGYGYVYPQFDARIQYTTPDMGGFKVSAGIYDPSMIAGVVGVATETDSPQFEGEASWAGSIAGTTDLAWISGMYQGATFKTGYSDVPGATNHVTCSAVGGFLCLDGHDVSSWGIGGGLQVGIPVGPGTLELMGSGYVGQALGLTFQQDVDALDFVGQERDHNGFIGQIGYAFGQGTKLQASYGESNAEETSAEKSCRTTNAATSGVLGFACPTTAAGVTGTGAVRTNIYGSNQSLWDIMLTHDVNPNLKLVAEYGRQGMEWFDGATQDADIFGVGAFFFW